MENKLDGNTATGTLQAIFSFDMTLVGAVAPPIRLVRPPPICMRWGRPSAAPSAILRSSTLRM
jgi:hypothetical protein